jgi:alpha-D-ribose 1-methylphosphonate 5-triphosphate synthase subunit PhnI
MFDSPTPILTAVLVRSLFGLGEEHEAAAFDLVRHLCLIAIAPTEGEMLEDIFSWRTYRRSFPNILILLKPSLACHHVVLAIVSLCLDRLSNGC